MDTLFTTADFSLMQQYFFCGATQEYDFRKAQLRKMRDAIKRFETDLSSALFKDLHKAKEEAYATEIGLVYAEITHALKHLQNWMYLRHVSSPLALFPSSGKVVRVPLGVTLIISPWNYPVYLLFNPLIGAIAGGNCAVLKPSESTPHTTIVINRIIEETFDKQYIRVVTGNGAEVVPKLMAENRFDHVFFTGSTSVGKELAVRAAEKLVPVTLELGGKSPCIVDKDVNLKVAAQRITWGKFTNAGQTCVAPDYLLVHESRKDELMDDIKADITRYYGKDPRQSNDYGRIINEQRFDRLVTYLKQGDIVTGGTIAKEELYISPTVMDNVGFQQPIMQEEVFGPILPVYSFKEHEEAIEIIRSFPDPLSLYVFTNNKLTKKKYTEHLQYGGGCINNTLVHLGNPNLPFGGVGSSGIGAYHGKFSFDTFTRPKAIVKTGTWLDPSLKYPPYKGKLKFLKWFIK